MANRKPNQLPHEDHVGIGKSLYDCRARLRMIAKDLGEAYRKDAKVNRLVNRALGAVEQLRCDLDTLVQAEHPGVASDREYYGHSIVDRQYLDMEARELERQRRIKA